LIPLLTNIEQKIINPVIYLLFALALLYFLWGVFRMVAGAASDTAREEGRQHVLWGVIGMFIMVAVYGILHAICNTIGC
jgi:hypothetical protein